MSGAGRAGRRRGLRRRDALHTYSLRFGPNMTPMVDIVMVILIFFMAATTFAGDEFFLRAGVVKETPAASARPSGEDPFALPPVRLTIELSAEGDGARTVATGVGLERVGVQELTEALKAFAQGTAVDRIVIIISAEPRVPYRDVVRVHDAATRLGIEKVAVRGE